MAAQSRRLNEKLDKFNPLVCCDGSVQKGYNPYKTTYQNEFPASQDLYKKCDSSKRRLMYKLRDEGKRPLGIITQHHNHNDKERSYNTQYCEDFNQLPRRNILPPERYFNVQEGERGEWRPEKSDHPVIGRPWNYGFTEQKQEAWRKEQEDMNKICFRDQYWPESWNYSRYSNNAYSSAQKYATPKQLSSKFFNPESKISRGPPHLFQPNEVRNPSELSASDKIARVELTRRIYKTKDVYPLTNYPGEAEQMHRENRMPLV